MMNGRLLWVDDEIEFLSVHILFLKEKGYEVTECTNGPDAIDLCKEQMFDLILLDENMPGLSGLETLDRIKEIQPDVPVVMVTKNEEEDLMNQAIGAKIADYLLKPVNPKQILLALKKNIHQKEIVSEAVETAYRKEFMELSQRMDEAKTPEAWEELYRRLVKWELELSTEEGPMAEMLKMQKTEANQAFAKYIAKNYETWIRDKTSRPLMSIDVLRQEVFPRLRVGKKVFLLVLDNLRYDQWRMLAGELSLAFDIDERLYQTILPTATQYARNALFSGLMPLQIQQQYPDLWVNEDEDEGKNLNEERLIGYNLQRNGLDLPFSYHKINDSVGVDRYLSHFNESLNMPLNVLVINFIDILSHARTESRMVRELAANEAAYRSITLSWFRHTAVGQLFAALAQTDFEIMITTDHGSIRASEPIKVVGDKNVNTNLRYKLGKSLGYKEKEVFVMKDPRRFGLPCPNLSTTYIFAQGNKFFAYPNNYNYYVQYYRDTFQHGGISLEEMLVPLVTLHSKNR